MLQHFALLSQVQRTVTLSLSLWHDDAEQLLLGCTLNYSITRLMSMHVAGRGSNARAGGARQAAAWDEAAGRRCTWREERLRVETCCSEERRAEPDAAVAAEGCRDTAITQLCQVTVAPMMLLVSLQLNWDCCALKWICIIIVMISGVIKSLNWCQISSRTAGKLHYCFRGGSWLCEQKMWSHSWALFCLISPLLQQSNIYTAQVSIKSPIMHSRDC